MKVRVPTIGGHLPLILFGLFSAVVLLLPVGSGQIRGLFWSAIWDLGHVGLGMGFAWALLRLPRVAALPVSGRWLFALLACAALAAAFEALQWQFGRLASVKDVLSTLAGTLLWLLLCCRPWPVAGRRRYLVTLFLVLLLAVPVSPLAWALYVHARAAANFPVLADFSSLASLGQWRDEQVRRVGHPTDPAAHALFVGIPAVPTGKRTGRNVVVHFDGFPADWSGYDDLLLEIHATAEVRVQLSLADEAYRRRRTYDRSDRFGATLDLRPGINHFRFSDRSWLQTPGGRRMDDRDIRQMVFMVRALPDASQSFVIGRIELVRGNT